MSIAALVAEMLANQWHSPPATHHLARQPAAIATFLMFTTVGHKMAGLFAAVCEALEGYINIDKQDVAERKHVVQPCSPAQWRPCPGQWTSFQCHWTVWRHWTWQMSISGGVACQIHQNLQNRDVYIGHNSLVMHCMSLGGGWPDSQQSWLHFWFWLLVGIK